MGGIGSQGNGQSGQELTGTACPVAQCIFGTYLGEQFRSGLLELQGQQAFVMRCTKRYNTDGEWNGVREGTDR